MSFTLKALHERAKEYFMADQVSVFLDFCKREFGKEPRDEVSETVFQGYVDNFKRAIKGFNKLFKENWGFAHQFLKKAYIVKMITNCYRHFRHFDLKYKNHCL